MPEDFTGSLFKKHLLRSYFVPGPEETTTEDIFAALQINDHSVWSAGRAQQGL